jgi:serine/threonine protein kinase
MVPSPPRLARASRSGYDFPPMIIGNGPDFRPLIPDFELLKVIGSGSYGEVWLARGVTGIFRAIKIVRRDSFTDTRPFEREFEGITRFSQVSIKEPSQLALLHVGRSLEGTFFYYVMELADDAQSGREIRPESYSPLTLATLLRQKGRLLVPEVVDLAVTVGRALAKLHELGLVHRDIKPSNVVFIGGVPKIADIGLVAPTNDELTFVGTQGYVAPEGPGKPGADVYGLGKIIYELATGIDRLEYPRLPEDFDVLEDRSAFLELNEVILKACDGDPAKRFHDAQGLTDELLLLQAGRSVKKLRRAEARFAIALRAIALLSLIAALMTVGAVIERQRAKGETERRVIAEAERDALARKTIYTALLERTERALEGENYGRARQLLYDIKSQDNLNSLSGFEWDVLWSEAQGDPSRLIYKGNTPNSALISPNGRMLAFGTSDHHARVVSLSDSAPIRDFSEVYQIVGFSPDSTWLLGIDSNDAPQRWNIANGEGAYRSKPQKGFRPLGGVGTDKLLLFRDSPVSTSNGHPANHHLVLWNYSLNSEDWNREIPTVFGGKGGDYYRAAISEDGTRCTIALIYDRTQWTTWRLLTMDVDHFRTIKSEPLDHRPGRLAFLDSNRLACTWFDADQIQLKDIDSDTWSKPLEVGLALPLPVARVSNTMVAVGGEGEAIHLIDIGTGSLWARLRGSSGGLLDIAVTRESDLVVGASSGGEIRAWPLNLARRPPSGVFEGYWTPPGGGRQLCLSDDGSLFAATRAFGRVDVVEIADGEIVNSISDALAPIAFDGAGELWVLSTAGHLELWEIGRVLRRDRDIDIGSDKRVIAACKALRGNLFAAIDSVGSLYLWDSQKQSKPEKIVSGTPYPWWVALSPDGKTVCISGNDRLVRFWDTFRAQPLGTWQSSVDALNGAFSPDSRKAAVALKNGSIAVFMLPRADSPSRIVETVSGSLETLQFHPTQPRLLISGQSGTVHIFDTQDWSEILELSNGHLQQGASPTVRLATSKNGLVFATYSADGRIHAWHSGVQINARHPEG